MIRKAVIPAAGFGTRFLPITKAQPKEMIPIVDTPVIQYVVEEAVASGITDILMIIGRGKRAVEEYFDRSFELEYLLKEKRKFRELDTIRRITDMANIHFVWQKEMNGLGDAILHARDHVGNEPFAVLLGDTIFRSEIPVTRQLVEVAEKYNSSVVGLEEVPKDMVSRYGIFDGALLHDNILQAKRLVEKPTIHEAPSNLSIASRYVFTPEIFSFLEKTPPGKNNEIQITDAMQALLQNEKIYGVKLKGELFDIGDKLEFIKTNILFGMEQEDIGESLKNWLKELAQKL
ncbi:UTP--glucose-1-phosphate uridylyltransferase GalU [Prolixibacter denitrificans]|uniref:UTP--glucose-1-phosphate uridylyltransferase n=1 Tax=Prolixibacter denitrificans TaxID=1541063 RepID=A0A2P8C9S7_9BACT|nr:UTP--glucose-1-phosphate uridylyltransferase GalU [Prolixibacter denitrificans]PSK81727.1 UTP--glucose-1-phosphate uridylyltransferase [Prolixibacter denitrificans]GET21248.1 UTP--glucose-1-phosphate uridylyltransferase [Prolixibacter denitrificans]